MKSLKDNYLKKFLQKKVNLYLEKWCINILSLKNKLPNVNIILRELKKHFKYQSYYKSLSVDQKQILKHKISNFRDKCESHFIHPNDFFNSKYIQINFKNKKTLLVKNTKYNNDVFIYVLKKFLHKGTYGTIYKYVLSKKLNKYRQWIHKDIQSIALKFDKGDLDESNIVQTVRNKNKTCAIVPLRLITKNKYKCNYIYAMKLLNMDLYEWMKLPNVTIKHILLHIPFIIKCVYLQLHCLLKINKKFIYADLKPENIGVILDSKDNTSIEEIVLIDIGSLDYEDNEYVTTYPCQKHNDGFVIFKNIKQKKRCIYVQLVILMFYLIYPKCSYQTQNMTNIYLNDMLDFHQPYDETIIQSIIQYLKQLPHHFDYYNYDPFTKTGLLKYLL